MQGRTGSTPDPSSAISSIYSEASIGGTSMERESSMGGLSIDFEKLTIEKGRPLDVDDLDDEGWAAASDQKKILELGSLGEGAGGAVTRCMLEGGKTIFALKVCLHPSFKVYVADCHRSSQQALTRMLRNKSCES
jgi:mitogen-activated protein kinase kinase